MKNFKKILHNCPYIVALSVTWLFLTLGGIILMIYRDYDGFDWKKFWSHPFFAVIMEEEMYADKGTLSGMDNAVEVSAQNQTAAKRDMEKILAVISNMQEKGKRGGKENEPPDRDIFNSLMPYNDDGMRAENRGGISFGASLFQIRGQDDVLEEELLTAEQTEGAPEQNDAEMENAENVENADAAEEEMIVGITLFTTYTPIETNSGYYYDVGKTALTTQYPYTKVTEEYFEDAAFFGDSRTLGIADYAELNADFYCENGMTIYKLLSEKGVTCQNSGEKTDLNKELLQKQYGKIYIMLGMNELGYGDTEFFKEQYQAVLEQIRQWQPQAVIYLMANLHVSRQKNNNATEFNNININAKNVAIAELADGINVFYLDSNPLFVDNDGFLKADLTFDGVHLYANNYPVWREFLMEHGVERKIGND